MSARDKFLKIVLPVLIIAAGIAGAALLVKSRQAPQKERPPSPGALVRVLTVAPSDHRIEVTATGTVQPQQRIEVTPQVSGRVVEVSPKFITGGFFTKGERLFAIEGIDYKLAVEQAAANLARAELNLATVEGQARVARQEWQRLRGSAGTDPNPLVLYDPQLKEARANVASARAALKQARLNLERTVLHAPFAARVSSEQVDLGQYVRAGSSVGSLAGTSQAEIVVPLALEEIPHLRIPGRGNGGPGSPAQVRMNLNGRSYTWSGRVVRSLGEMDPRGRMARVVVAVDDPYQLHARHNTEKPDLAVGMFVELTLQGTTLQDVVRIPRRALRENSSVWVVDSNNELRIRPVRVVRREREHLFIADGLSAGERIVLTNLSGAADGMALRPAEEGAGR
jgi:RND family efflux transporter MFP subunit